MEIIKKLSLNKDYQNVDNGSLVFAKNMRVSDDYSYLTNDYGFIDSIIVEEGETNPLVDKSIVGVIPCDRELVVFASDGNNSYIFRFEEINIIVNDDIKETRLNLKSSFSSNDNDTNGWHYKGGVITGTYTYNVEHQLIIAFSEYDSNYKIPLKVINLDTYDNNISEDKLTPAPEVPVANLAFNSYIKTAGIPNGVYYFFIRYKISNDNYTNWFPIGGVYYALRRENTIIIRHQYNTKSSTEKNNVYSCTEVVRGINNVSKDSNRSFNFTLNLSNSTLYNECQIAYILQKENANFGRIWKSFDINNTNSITFNFDAKFKEEIGVDDLLSNSFQLYNTKHLASYEGRLYIANYEETNYNQELANAVDNVTLLFNRPVNSSPLGAHSGTFNEKNSDTVNLVTFKISVTDEWAAEASINLEPIYITAPVGTRYIRIGDYTALKDFINKASVWRINTIPEWDSRNAQNSKIISGSTTNQLEIMPLGGLYAALPATTIDNCIGQTTLFQHFYRNESGLTFVDACPDADYVCLNARYKYTGAIIPDEAVAYFRKYSFTIEAVDLSVSVEPGSNGQVNQDDVVGDYVSNTEHAIGTFMPGEYYQFFIHFVRKDGTYTNGYKIPRSNISFTSTINEVRGGAENNNDYVEKLAFQSNVVAITLSAQCSSIPEGFVGYFISYAKPETTVLYQAYCLGAINTYGSVVGMFGGQRDNQELNAHLRGFKASDVESGLINYNVTNIVRANDLYNGSSLKEITVNEMGIMMSGGGTIVAGNSVSAYNSDGKIVAYIDQQDIPFGLYYAYNKVNSSHIYVDEDKELIRLGDIVTDTSLHEFLSMDSNYPSYIVKDECVRIIGVHNFSDDGEVYMAGSWEGESPERIPDGSKYAELLTFERYSHFNLYAMSFKKEPAKVATVLGVGKRSHSVLSTIVKPNDLSDLVHLESAFIPNNLKAYKEYNQYYNYSPIKTNVIRRSDIISDESLETSWRMFRPNNYKVIHSDKGIITNIVGAGNVFLIHCEHTLLCIDRSQMLKTNDKVVQTAIPDTFEVEPMDLFTSQHGYGGLQIINAWCLNHYGYFFLDSDSRKLFNYDNNQINDLTGPIVKWFKDKKFKRANFLTDAKNNRIFIRLIYEDTSVLNTEEDTLVLSYYPELKSFVSIHDFDFGVNCSTKNNAYFLKQLPYSYVENNMIMIMSDTVRRSYYNSFSKPNMKFYHIAVYRETPNGQTISSASIVDIIFNYSYELIKSLESISYILSNESTHKPEDYNGYDWFGEITENDEVIAKLFDEDKYSGDVLRIYTDSTDSGILDIDINSLDKANKGENLNKEYETPLNDLSNAYKYPYYDKGIWNLNYFRNLINNNERTSALIQKAKEIILKKEGLTINDLSQEQLDKLEELAHNFVYSDQLSLIYGKYIVLRFIFYNDVPIKFENVIANLNRY